MNPTRRGLLRISLFLSLTAAAAFGVDALINAALRRVETGELGVWNAIVHGEINADVIVSGSSRALVHYDPRVLEEVLALDAHNIALNASRTDLQLARLKTYLQHNRKPRLVIQNLDAHSLARSEGIYEPGNFMPYLGEDPVFEALRKAHPDAWKWKHIPLYGYAVEDVRHQWAYGVLDALGWSKNSIRIDGYEPRNLPWTGDFEALRGEHPDGVTIDHEPEGVRTLVDLIAFCQNQGIPLVLVYSPEYLEMVQLTRNRGEIFRTFRSVARRMDVMFLDYTASDFGANRTNFYNSQHMNAPAAAEFSRDLALKLREAVPGLRSDGPDRARPYP